MVRYVPDRFAAGLSTVAAAAAWLLALTGLIGAVTSIWRPGAPLLPSLILFCCAAPTCIVALRARSDIRRIRAVTAGSGPRRRYGDLEATGVEEHRGLRPIGVDRAHVIGKTDTLLEELLEIPSVQLFRGVRLAGEAQAAAAHAVTAGRFLAMVESVEWPPGRYAVDASGRIRCDGHATGQSVSGLASAVGAYRTQLPRRHRVRALVVVHRTGPGDYQLPSHGKDIDWAFADDAVAQLRGVLAPHHRTTSRYIVAALTRPATRALAREEAA